MDVEVKTVLGSHFWVGAPPTEPILVVGFIRMFTGSTGFWILSHGQSWPSAGSAPSQLPNWWFGAEPVGLVKWSRISRLPTRSRVTRSNPNPNHQLGDT